MAILPQAVVQTLHNTILPAKKTNCFISTICQGILDKPQQENHCGSKNNGRRAGPRYQALHKSQLLDIQTRPIITLSFISLPGGVVLSWQNLEKLFSNVNIPAAIKMFKMGLVILLEAIGKLHLPSQPLKLASHFLEEIRPAATKSKYNLSKEIPFSRLSNKALEGKANIPESAETITLNTLDHQLIKVNRNELLHYLDQNLNKTGDELNSVKGLKQNIKDALGVRFEKSPETKSVYIAAKDQINELNDLTLGKCNDAIRKIATSQGIHLEKSDALLIAAAVLLPAVIIS